jgi:TPR repeat protein
MSGLGYLYATGRGVPQDDKAAHTWFSLAAVAGDPEAARSRDILARRLTPDEIREAEEFAAAWRPTRP